MNFEALFPELIYLNLAKRQDRRGEFEEHAEELELRVKRFPGINSSFVRNRKGFETDGRYAHSLATRIALRRAMRSGADTFFMFEDDAVIRKDFREILEETELPDDWGIFYLGCQHHIRPGLVSKNLVRVKYALDTHAWGCKAVHFRRIYEHLSSDFRDPSGFKAATDMTLAELHEEIPTYAIYPNVCWQQVDHSDLAGGTYSNYDETGTHLWFKEEMAGLAADAISGKSGTAVDGEAQDQQPTSGRKVAMLFLTRGEHGQSKIWEEYLNSASHEISVYGHAKERELLDRGGWLENAQIAEHLETGWGEIGLVKAQLALLRKAVSDPGNRWFIFASEACVPIRPFADLKNLLEIDGRSRFLAMDWAEQEEIGPWKLIRCDAAPGIPTAYWQFHSQWVLLNRQAAELILAEDFTKQFANTFAADESYFGTVLSMCGFDVSEGVADCDVTWTAWPKASTEPHPLTYGTVDDKLAGELVASGKFFARKFSDRSNIGTYRLHLP